MLEARDVPRSSRARSIAAVIGAGIVAVTAACTLVTSLDGLSGGQPADGDGGGGNGDGGAGDGAARSRYLVVAGGVPTSGFATNEVHLAKVLADGKLDVWRTQRRGLPAPTGGLAMVSRADTVFVLGGEVGAGGSVDVNAATLDEAAELGVWRAQPPLARTYVQHAATANATTVYVTGGFLGVGENDVASWAFAGANLRALDAGPDMVDDHDLHAIAATNDALVVVGGLGNGGARAVEVANLRADGTIEKFVKQTVRVPTDQIGHRAVAHGADVYLTGGEATPKQVLRGRVSQGAIGSWAVLGGMAVGRHRHGSVVAGDFIYVLGGATAGSLSRSVEVAPIAADGSIGAWTQTTELPVALRSLGVAAVER